MTLKERLLAEIPGLPARFEEQKDGSLALESVVAERKSFLSRKKLTYRCRVRLDEAGKEVKLFEILKESGFGMSGVGDDMAPGFGFKKETWKSDGKTREGTLEEQSRLFGKDYSYKFDFALVRKAVEQAAADAGFSFTVCLREKSLSV
jgi:hypothetical protein